MTLPTLFVNVILHLNAEFLLQKQWKPVQHMGETLPPRVFTVPRNSATFGNYYDEIQEILKCIAGMDELLQGSTR